MSKVAVVYWSGTGNTEAMANAVADGIQSKGAEAVMLGPSDFTKDMVAEYDAIAFGCPAMGAEQLEEAEYQPMWDDVKAALCGKKIALFATSGGSNIGQTAAKLKPYIGSAEIVKGKVFSPQVSAEELKDWAAL